MAGALTAAALLAGCGSGATPDRSGTAIPPSLLAGARPIGRGARFHPPASGPVDGRCRPTLGRRSAAHVELFAADRVVLIAAGVGARPPLQVTAGRVSGARCFGRVVTLDPTGTVLVAPGRRPATLADLFRAWGQPLSATRLGPFRAPRRGRVTVFVDGRARPGTPSAVPLRAGAEIVLEIGPHVPPHRLYSFPPLPPASLR